MNKITKKLLLSVLTVILAIGALGTTTFAWFTLSNIAKIDMFEANILGEYGIEISVDESHWYNNITQELIVTEYGLQNFKFNHVTTSDGEVYSSIDGSHNVVPEVNDNLKNKSYLEFEIFFRSVDLTQIKLTGITLIGNEHVWTSDVAFAEYANGASINVNSINALRISFQGEDAEKDSFIVAYERDNYSDAGAFNTYMDTDVDYANNTALKYYEVKNSGDYPGKGELPSLLTTKPLELDQNGFADLVTQETEMIFNLNTQYTDANTIEYNKGSVVIRVWIEGFDAEAYNAILDLPIIFGLVFEGVKQP